MSGEIACPGCDLLIEVPALGHGESASCPRCGSFLTRTHDDAYHRVLAFASAGVLPLLNAIGDQFQLSAAVVPTGP